MTRLAVCQSQAYKVIEVAPIVQRSRGSVRLLGRADLQLTNQASQVTG